ncbi:Ger(x)C family spore germination protein [Pseudalkalibacillus decolorationis]|uniref:Ger(x)C family spore germination protein n=1 Tax=Pseudalkalibacillus decolorationis TaxID=163879 RepID=UPI0021496B4B|nr:Ger(x)C family spore germination protein [Pseudalkalibacillus decolorationis]
MTIKHLSLLICIVILTGCVPTSIVEEVNYMKGKAYDYVDGDNFKTTISIPIYPKGEKTSGGIENGTISAIGKTSEEIEEMIDYESPRPIEDGHLNTVLFSEEILDNGIMDFLDSLTRNPQIGRTVQLAVVKGEAAPYMKFQTKGNIQPPDFIYDVLSHAMEESFPRTNIHKFLYQYYGKGMDPFLPFLTLTGDRVKIDGIALFDKDRYVGRLPYRMIFIFKMLSEGHVNGAYRVTMKDSNDDVLIETISSSIKRAFKGSIENPVVSITVDVKGVMEEAHFPIGSGEKRGANIKKIEKQFEETLQKRGLELIKQLQQKKIDPLSIGNYIRSRMRDWNKEKWETIYPEMEIQLKVNVSITGTGVSE